MISGNKDEKNEEILFKIAWDHSYGEIYNLQEKNILSMLFQNSNSIYAISIRWKSI